MGRGYAKGLHSGRVEFPANYPKIRAHARFWNIKSVFSAISYLAHSIRWNEIEINHLLSLTKRKMIVLFENGTRHAVFIETRNPYLSGVRAFSLCDPQECSITFALHL
jgi:hypothetical protein